MQVQAFRKVNSFAFASTMCIGNIRSGMEALAVWIVRHDPKALRKVFHYFGIIFLFGVGAGLGWVAVEHFATRAIWWSCLLLVICFALMFIQEDLEDNPAIEQDLAEIRQEAGEIDHLLKKELHEGARGSPRYAGTQKLNLFFKWRFFPPRRGIGGLLHPFFRGMDVMKIPYFTNIILDVSNPIVLVRASTETECENSPVQSPLPRLFSFA